MKSYNIYKMNGRVLVTVQDDKWTYQITPEQSQEITNHSPTGFEFGYGGSGPAQLALAILMDFTGRVPHPSFYHAFKWQFIAPMDAAGGTISGDAIREFMERFEEVDPYVKKFVTQWTASEIEPQ